MYMHVKGVYFFLKFELLNTCVKGVYLLVFFLLDYIQVLALVEGQVYNKYKYIT